MKRRSTLSLFPQVGTRTRPRGRGRAAAIRASRELPTRRDASLSVQGIAPVFQLGRIRAGELKVASPSGRVRHLATLRVARGAGPGTVRKRCGVHPFEHRIALVHVTRDILFHGAAPPKRYASSLPGRGAAPLSYNQSSLACPRSCIELAGASPVEVRAELPRSYPRPPGEIPTDKRGDKGGSVRREPMRGTTSDAAGRNKVKPAASLDYTKPKGPEAEMDMITRRQKTALGTRSGAGLRRGTGSSTQQEFNAEVGRPSPVALGWAGRLYKAKAEVRRSREGVRGGHSTRDREDEQPHVGKVLCFGHARRGRKDGGLPHGTHRLKRVRVLPRELRIPVKRFAANTG